MDGKTVKDWLRIIAEILEIILSKGIGEEAAIGLVARKHSLPIDEVRKHFKERK